MKDAYFFFFFCKLLQIRHSKLFVSSLKYLKAFLYHQLLMSVPNIQNQAVFPIRAEIASRRKDKVTIKNTKVP